MRTATFPRYCQALSIWVNLPDHLQMTIRKSDILFVLMKQAEYWELSEEHEINVSAFLNERQYLERELGISHLPLSSEGMKIVLKTADSLENGAKPVVSKNSFY